MSKNKKDKVEKEVETESALVDDGTRPSMPPEEFVQPVSNSKKQLAVSIVPKIKNNRHVYEIVKFTFEESGGLKNKEIIHTTINEHTAMTLLFETAHQTFTVKELRKQVKELKGGN